MKSINFPALFDDFIIAPNLDASNITEGFRGNDNRKGVYTVFNSHFEPLYIGSSKDLRRRLWEHRSKNMLKEHLSDILFIGIKYVESGDPSPTERKYIRELKPLINKYRYGGSLRVNEY